MIETSRRAFLRGMFAAPAIVAVQNLMPVKSLWVPTKPDLVTSGGFLLQPYYKEIYAWWKNEYATMPTLWPEVYALD